MKFVNFKGALLLFSIVNDCYKLEHGHHRGLFALASTIDPTSSPTSNPSSSPTSNPSLSLTPTASPTLSEIPSSTVTPSSSPSLPPTPSPTATVTPTSSPSLSPTSSSSPSSNHSSSPSSPPSTTQFTTASTSTWSFIIAADWHGAESFAIDPVTENQVSSKEYSSSVINLDYLEYRKVFQHIHSTYGGDFLMLPGDSNTGHWYTNDFVQKLQANTDTIITSTLDAIAIGGQNCYSTMKRLFQESGYEKVFLAVGDHEIGGNPWKSGAKVEGQSVFRYSLAEVFNKDENNGFRFSEPIGTAPSRPIGTEFATTSYAVVHNNALIVTIDAFRDVGTKFYKRHSGQGGEGSVTCTVHGDHLVWFEDVLSQARLNESIKHIFVQAHVPIAQPVRKMSCSGQFFDKGTESPFWKVMQKYNVDAYFAGEVHANTATKDSESDLIQVVSRGNRLQNFLQVEVSDDEFRIYAYNEVGEKAWFNANYTQHGQLNVIKNGSSPSTITSHGALKLHDADAGPLLKFKFEKEQEHSLYDRQVIGMKYDTHEETLLGHSMTIQNTTCTKGIINSGSFGEQYNLQVGDHALSTGIEGDALLFDENTEVAIYSMGPMGQGGMVTTSLYFKTSLYREMILIFYGGRFGYNKNKDIFLLTLKSGNPIFYVGEENFLHAAQGDLELNDDEWHHISISMPSDSCQLSEVLMFVDGERIETTVTGANKPIFFITSGQLSLGGWGYSNARFGDQAFSKMKKFVGMMDEFQLWGGRTVSETLLLKGTITKEFDEKLDVSCMPSEKRIRIGARTAKNCKELCSLKVPCLGYELIKKKRGRKYKCFHFMDTIVLGEEKIGTQCNSII